MLGHRCRKRKCLYDRAEFRLVCSRLLRDSYVAKIDHRRHAARGSTPSHATPARDGEPCELPNGGALKPGSADDLQITTRLGNVTTELRQIQDDLLSADDLDPSILAAFRDAVNRVRTTAWAMQQYANSKATDNDPKSVLSLMAGERVRVAYQLCKLVQADLADEEIHVQKGPLLQLHAATKELAEQLAGVVGE